MSGWGSLFPQHVAMLESSGITPELAAARGYRSVDRKARLQQVGVTPAGRRIPGLLVPCLRVDGSVWGYQYRPDSPRERAGKPVKYETPTGQRNGLDVPPGVGRLLADPAVPLWVTEGVKKADAGAVVGLCIVALPGVWSWRGRNQKGGTTAIPDWHDVALNERRVILGFDSDVTRKPSVHKALDDLSRYLTSKGALVAYCHLPDDQKGKTGLDDYLASGHTVEQLQTLVRPEPPDVKQGDSSGSASSAGSSGSMEGVGPQAEPETGRLLDEIRDWLGRFIITIHNSDLDVLTLWATHTHLAVETYTTPRLLIDSPVPASGKTTVLEHLERLCLHPVQMASLSSPALLTRMLHAGLRTLLIDEADRCLSADKPDVGEFLAVLNSGYKRGATRPVLVPLEGGGWRAEEMPTFSPVAMAGNSPNLPDDTRSRSIRVLLMPDQHGDAEESDWELLDDQARELGQRLARWADQVRDEVRTSRPPLPDLVRGRARERWSPLKRVAVAAGGRWPSIVDELAVRDVERIEAERDEGILSEKPAIVLLRHLHEAWSQGERFVTTETLIERLVRSHGEIWGEQSSYGRRLTPQRLGRMLVTAFDIRSDRPDSNGPRGYLAATLNATFERFGLPPHMEPDEPAEPAEPDDVPAPARPMICVDPLPGFVLPTGPGRCPDCGFHIPTQGHRSTCPSRRDPEPAERNHATCSAHFPVEAAPP